MGKIKFWTGMMEVFSFFVLITVIVFFVISYTTLPERIPMAFIGSGEPVEGGKIYFLITFWLGFCSYGLLFILKRFPRLMSYPVKITPENVDLQARLAKLMLSILTLFCMLIILVVLYDLYARATSSAARGSVIPVVVLFAGIFLDVGIYILIAKKNK